ncbi:MAG: glycosyltransferase [Sedimentisphaerales bacterium]|nr:glycosyltransferase [Sedimentisphaerales bacterium]
MGDVEVTIGTAFYNVGPAIQDMIRSILTQTFERWELILLDDGSTDESYRLAERFRDPRIRLVRRSQNCGIPTVLNAITEMAQGNYIARMDADDLSSPTRIEKQLAYLQNHPEIDLVGTGIVYLDEHENPIGSTSPSEQHKKICANPGKGIGISHGSILAKKRWFEDHLYDASLRRGSDYELLLRSHQQSCYANVSEPLYYYRLASSFRLTKQLSARLGLARHVSQYYRREKQYGHVLSSLIVPPLKFLAEAGLCLLGRKEYLLSRRYSPLSKEEREKYRMELEQIKSIRI